MAHHGLARSRAPSGTDAGALQRSASSEFRQILEQEMAQVFPVVRWRGQARRALSTPPALPGLVALACVITVGILTSLVVPADLAFAIGGSVAIVILLVSVVVPRVLPFLGVDPRIRLVLAVILSSAVSTVWSVASSDSDIRPAVSAAVTAVAVLLTLLAFSWVNAVLTARRDQADALAEEADRRAAESAAAMSSLSAIVMLMSRVEPLSGSAAIAACAAGLQRACQGIDPSGARRILDWTESVVSASVAPDPSSIATRIEQTINPWRALADISVECEDWDPADSRPSDAAVEGLLQHIDRVVQDSCRVEQAEVISIAVHGTGSNGLTVDVELDGVPAPHFAFSAP